MSHTVHIPCIPPKTTAQTTRRYTKNGGVYTDKRGMEVKESWLALLAPHAPELPYECPVELFVTFTWPWRASETKKRRAQKWLPMDTKPDLDNLAKTFLDTMVTCGYMVRDQLVWKLTFVKGWGDIPGVNISMRDDNEQFEQYMQRNS